MALPRVAQPSPYRSSLPQGCRNVGGWPASRTPTVSTAAGGRHRRALREHTVVWAAGREEPLRAFRIGGAHGNHRHRWGARHNRPASGLSPDGKPLVAVGGQERRTDQGAVGMGADGGRRVDCNYGNPTMRLAVESLLEAIAVGPDRRLYHPGGRVGLGVPWQS